MFDIMRDDDDQCETQRQIILHCFVFVHPESELFTCGSDLTESLVAADQTVAMPSAVRFHHPCCGDSSLKSTHTPPGMHLSPEEPSETHLLKPAGVKNQCVL